MRLKPKTEAFLYFLLWNFDIFMRPTFRNLTGSFEEWAYRNGFMRELAELERAKLIERRAGTIDRRICRLTEGGRLHVLQGRDPQASWSRRWDGHWRMVLFDVPVEQENRRQKLRRCLRLQRFGCLQQSVWISPDPFGQQISGTSSGINVESFILIEGRPVGGETDQQIVNGAWNFDKINQAYRNHLRVLGERPAGKLTESNGAKALREWATRERQAWEYAVTSDPLLPDCLLPPGYLGREAWKRRNKTFAEAARQIKSFHS